MPLQTLLRSRSTTMYVSYRYRAIFNPTDCSDEEAYVLSVHPLGKLEGCGLLNCMWFLPLWIKYMYYCVFMWSGEYELDLAWYFNKSQRGKSTDKWINIKYRIVLSELYVRKCLWKENNLSYMSLVNMFRLLMELCDVLCAGDHMENTNKVYLAWPTKTTWHYIDDVASGKKFYFAIFVSPAKGHARKSTQDSL